MTRPGGAGSYPRVPRIGVPGPSLTPLTRPTGPVGTHGDEG